MQSVNKERSSYYLNAQRREIALEILGTGLQRVVMISSAGVLLSNSVVEYIVKKSLVLLIVPRQLRPSTPSNFDDSTWLS